MSPRSHNNPGSDWRRGGEGLILHPLEPRRERREEETTSTSHVEICVDIPLLNLIVNEWFIAGPGERPGDPPYTIIIRLADWKWKLRETTSPAHSHLSLNLQHFAIYDWAAARAASRHKGSPGPAPHASNVDQVNDIHGAKHNHLTQIAACASRRVFASLRLIVFYWKQDLGFVKHDCDGLRSAYVCM